MMWRLRLALPPALGGHGDLLDLRPRSVVWCRGSQVVCEREGLGSGAADDLLEAVENELLAAGPEAQAIGFLSYELASSLDPRLTHPAGCRALPDAWWAILDRGAASGASAAASADSFAPVGDLTVSLDMEGFCGAVETIRHQIAAGSYYQVNLTRRWSVRLLGDPAGLFYGLRSGMAPRYAAYLEDREQGWAVISMSPELLVARRGGTVTTRPIKGTRPRGQVSDEAAGRELDGSVKDAAELAMIVDLERNDLNRVCRPGSVKVASPARPLLTVDVVHREASITGQLAEGVGWREILRAILPGGSVTGAPKIAACRAISELEPVPRSVYCGALGVLDSGGVGTLALPIRSGYVAESELFFHAGCGIVWESDAADEEAESRAKVRSWLEVLGV